MTPPGQVAGRAPAIVPGTERVSERLFGLAGLSNVGRVANGIFRGAQPEPEGYATLKAMGVRTVVNLRTRHGERKAVEAAGMRYVEIPMSFWRDVDPAVVRLVLTVMTDPASQPVFVHCSRGADRTGVVAAVYRMEVDGWSEAEAEAEMEAFGFHGIWSQLKEYVRRYPGVPEEVREEVRDEMKAGDGP
jgi:tyrosine-protein phosphatase SIW14